MVPVSINSIHDFLDHEHGVCSSKIEKHIHEKDVDCKLNLLKQSTPLLTTNDYQTELKTIISNDDSLQYTFLKDHFQLSFSLRGPPLYVQA